MEELVSTFQDQIETVNTELSGLEEYFAAHVGGVDEEMKAALLSRSQDKIGALLSKSQCVIATAKECLDKMLFHRDLVTAGLTERILHLGANIHAREHGMSVLPAAELGGRYEIVGTLLAYGADVNQRDDLGYSPLHYACDRTHRPCIQNVRTLLRAGADATALSGFSHTQTPVEWLEEGHEEIGLLLRQVDTRRKWGFIDMLRRRAGTETGSVRERPVVRRRSPRLATASAIGAVEFLQRGAPEGVFHAVMSFL